jgi:hypothetical protein
VPKARRCAARRAGVRRLTGGLEARVGSRDGVRAQGCRSSLVKRLVRMCVVGQDGGMFVIGGRLFRSFVTPCSIICSGPCSILFRPLFNFVQLLLWARMVSLFNLFNLLVQCSKCPGCTGCGVPTYLLLPPSHLPPVTSGAYELGPSRARYQLTGHRFHRCPEPPTIDSPRLLAHRIRGGLRVLSHVVSTVAIEHCDERAHHDRTGRSPHGHHTALTLHT